MGMHLFFGGGGGRGGGGGEDKQNASWSSENSEYFTCAPYAVCKSFSNMFR